MEKSKTSICREWVSKTLSKVNAPAASLDYQQGQPGVYCPHILDMIYGQAARKGEYWLTLMRQVSSDSKSTMDSPPAAISVLFGGRNRATTSYTSQYRSRKYLTVLWSALPLIVLPEFALLLSTEN